MEKNKKLKLFIFIGAFLLLIILLFILRILGVFYNPVNITTSSLTKLASYNPEESVTTKALNEIVASDKHEFDFNLESKELATNINLGYQLDRTNSIMLTDVKADYQNANLLFLNGQINEDKMYFKFLENMNKYYYIEDDFKEFFKILKNPDDSNNKKIVGYLNDSIMKNISKKDFKKSSSSVVINDKEIKATKYSLPITKNLIYNLFNDFFKNLENDKEIWQQMIKNNGTSEEEFKNQLKKTLEQIKALDDSNFSSVKYNVYTKLGSTIMYELNINGIRIAYTIKNNKELSFRATPINMVMKFEDEKINVLLTDGTKKILEGKITGQENKKFEFKVNENSNIVISGNLTYKEIKKNNEYKIIFDMKITNAGEETNINTEMIVKKIKELTNIDTSNSLNINSLSEQEKVTLGNELMQIPLFQMIYEFSNQDTNNSVSDL